jgi:hypothetical protein
MNSFSAHNLTTTGFSMNEQMEELLVQYCDGTLSASNHARFEALLRENPAFAEEVRAIASFDEMIDHAHLETRWADQIDTAFLSEMQQQLAHAVTLGAAVATASVGAAAGTTVSASTAEGTASVGIGTASAVAGGAIGGISASGFTAFLTGTLIGKSLLVAGVCTAVGYGAWKYTASSPNASNVPAPAESPKTTTDGQISRETAQSQPSAANAEQSGGTKSSELRTKQEGNAVDGASSQNAQQQSLLQSPEAASSLTSEQEDKSKANANIESNAAQDLRNKIEQLSVQLRIKEQSGNDKAGVAFDAKKLGMLERTAGKYAESNEFFDKALKAAQAVKLRELEGEIRAELALLYREQGNTEKALASLREAVKILTDEASTKAGRWAKELERWEKR